MSSLIVGFPLRGAISAGFGGRWLGGSGASLMTTGLVRFTCILSWRSFIEIGLGGSPVRVEFVPWRKSGGVRVSWSFLYDTLTAVRLIVVTTMSSLVHLYSMGYRSEDPHRPRFRAYLSLFTFFRLILVTAGNLVQRFVGWEGVGLCSYLLINFWFTRLQANKAAVKARLMNRVGDLGLRLGRLVLYWEFHTLDYAALFARAPRALGHTVTFLSWEFDVLTLACLLLFVGSVGKSAQLGLHAWLPDAREGPTPVSALMHAATRVTAGVFLLARCSPLFELAPRALAVVTVFGARTAFFAGSTGLAQHDLKRVIAYSTCSQLGYRVFACGLSSYSVAVFHLANHAFFKALLFLAAGSVIHARADEQDRRRRGGLVKLLPLTYAARRMGSVALRGFPFLAGFYSKDMILEAAYASYTVPGHFAHLLGTAGAFCTAYYSRRLRALTFLGEAHGARRVREGVHEAPRTRALPLRMLSVGSLVVGWLGRDRFIGVGSSFWGNALFTHPGHLLALEGEFLPAGIKLVPIFFSILGVVLAVGLFFSGQGWLVARKLGPRRRLHLLLNRSWLWNRRGAEVTQGALHIAYHHTYLTGDRGLLERLGPYGIVGALQRRAQVQASRQSGQIYHAALRRFLGVGLARVVFAGGSQLGTLLDLRLRRVRMSLVGFSRVHSWGK